MSQPIRECDVLIVGAGPAGLSVASTLPDDVRTIVVHQDAEIGKPVRTSGGSWLSDMERLNIPPDCYLVLDKYEAFADKVHVTLPIRENKVVILAITRLYRWLASLSDEKDRALLLNTKFTGAARQADGTYLSTIRRRGGADQQIRSRFIVDGSGWHFAVLRALGLREPPERRGVGIEYEFPLADNAPDRAFIFTGRTVPAGYGWGFPTPEGTFRLGVGIIRPDTEASPRKLIDAVMAANPEQRFGIRLSKDYTVNGGILPSVAYDPKLVFGNVIRVGDSANFATPTVGEGIRICIDLGRDLGEALGRTVKTGRRWPLWLWQAKCRWRLQRNYFFGFVMNTRGARFNPAQWNASIARMGRAPEDALVDVLRSEFRIRKMALMAWFTIRGRIERRWHRLMRRRG